MSDNELYINGLEFAQDRWGDPYAIDDIDELQVIASELIDTVAELDARLAQYYDFIDSLTHGDPSRLFEIATSLGWKQRRFEGDLTGEWASAAKWAAARMPFPEPPEATP